MPPSHKRGVFRTFVHRKKTSPREVESLYHKKSPLVNSCGRFFRIFRRPAEERRGGRENLRRDTPPAHTASGGAARRTVEFAAGYAAHVPGGTASGKTDAAGSRGRIPTSGEGTDSQIPSSVCASRAGLAVSHLFCLGGGARNLVCLPRRTRSPVRFRFGCSISMLGVLPHIFSRFPAPPRSLRCAGDNVRATSFASASDAQSRPLSRAGTVSAYLRSRAEDRLRQMCAASPAFPHRV